MKIKYAKDRFIEYKIGNCIDVMKTYPDKYFSMVMTSPPYWGLRSYQGSETVWDGDGNCEHIWNKIKHASKGGKTKSDNMPKVGANRTEQDDEISIRFGYTSNFCQKCNAWKGQLGLEPTFDLYLKHLCDIFDEVKRVLRDDGTIWVNLGDIYAGSCGSGWKQTIENTNRAIGGGNENLSLRKQCGRIDNLPSKSLIMIPFRFAIEMVNRGWILRNNIIWHKNNCMPSSVKDRFTVDYEYLFFFSKKKKYYFEQQFESFKSSDKEIERQYSNGTKETAYATNKNYSGGVGFGCKGRNKRTVWTINPRPFKDAHFAVFPKELCETPIKAGCQKDGIILDPFVGSGSTLVVAERLNRSAVGIDINDNYEQIIRKRINTDNARLEKWF